jgi:hypothetical protein
MERAYREDELADATIIDSEGYIYGKLEKINIDDDGVVCLAYEGKPDVRTVVDVNSLRDQFLRKVKTSVGSRFRRSVPQDILEDNIRKELGLALSEHVGDEHYVKYAERLGVPMPYTKATVERKEQKGTVNLNEIRTIRISVIGKEKWTKLIKIILLNEPKEAEFRKIPIQKKVPFRATEAIKDKLVLDSEGNVLGYVDSVVLFHETPGIRVYISKPSGQVSLGLLTRFLEESGKSDTAASVKEYFSESAESHRYTATVEELEDFMQQKNVSFRLPEHIMTDLGSREFVADIPWDEIQKIGDVVLLRSKSSDLRGKGYF